jgi:hypothetical protein
MDCLLFVQRLKDAPENAAALVDAWFPENGNSDDALIELARSVGLGYVRGEVPFVWANAAISKLMSRRNWKAPAAFWKVFVAFEDLELDDAPGDTGRDYVRAAMESAVDV